MRLIDADKIDFNEVFIGASDFARDTRESAQMLIDAQTTIEAAPVVHGEWKKVKEWATKTKYRCSICGREIMSATKVNTDKYPYCHCGAKMKGGE